LNASFFKKYASILSILLLLRGDVAGKNGGTPKKFCAASKWWQAEGPEENP
jgi:hypothetical protein